MATRRRLSHGRLSLSRESESACFAPLRRRLPIHPRIPHRLTLRTDHVQRRVNERQVRERVREVAQVTAGVGVEVLGV